MSTLTEPKAGRRPQAQGERLRMASLGALTMLILQFVALGCHAVNLVFLGKQRA